MENPVRNNLTVELHVPDFELVREFYSKLDFSVISEDPIGRELGYLVLMRHDSIGNSMLNFYGGDERVFNHSFFSELSPSTPRGYAVEITIPVGDIERYYAEIYPRIESSVVQKLVTKSWGKKDFRIRDPFGFYLRFTELVDWGQN